MLQLEDARVCSLEEVVTKFVLDIELVYAKLCVNVTLAFNDIVYVQKQVSIEELQTSLNTLLVLLRKHIGTLEKLPHTIFQTLLNEGGPELSSEALNLLETKYSKMAYMEYLHKEDQPRIQTTFRCSDIVVRFDVSPKLDYMVCQGESGTIELWSLHTGKQLWNQYFDDSRVNLSECDDGYLKTVVFHPEKDLVLPGMLSHGYSFDGDLEPLFPSSKCCFSIHSISADKTKMLTDCHKDTKAIIMWSLKDGSEMNRFVWSDDIRSFAWSPDGRRLAVSGYSDSIGLLDAMDGFRTLVQTTYYDSRIITMKHSRFYRLDACVSYLFTRLDVNIENDGDCSYCPWEFESFSETGFENDGDCSYCPWEFESCSETGFLTYSPFCWTTRDAFVLNRQSVLRVEPDSNIIQMLHPGELTKDSAERSVQEVVYSLHGDTLFVVTGGIPATLLGWDISSGMFKPGKVTGLLLDLVAVKEGVLLQSSRYTLELWNFELSECIRSWTDIQFVTKVIPISEERVACKGWIEVIIVDTTSEGIESTIPIPDFFLACNSKCHVLTTDKEGLQMQCGDKVLWKMSMPPFTHIHCTLQATFSPTEQYCVVAGSQRSCDALCVLDSLSGKTVRILELELIIDDSLGREMFDFKFVSDEECVTCYGDALKGYFLQLFNVKSGDLLSQIAFESGPVCGLAACPRKRLIAIGFEDFKVDFKVLQVKLPGDKHSRKSKRIKPQE